MVYKMFIFFLILCPLVPRANGAEITNANFLCRASYVPKYCENCLGNTTVRIKTQAQLHEFQHGLLECAYGGAANAMYMSLQFSKNTSGILQEQFLNCFNGIGIAKDHLDAAIILMSIQHYKEAAKEVDKAGDLFHKCAKQQFTGYTPTAEFVKQCTTFRAYLDLAQQFLEF